MYLKTSMALFVPALLAGCSLTPALRTPPLPVPATYAPPQQSVDAGVPRSIEDIGWERMFGDPRLQRLIALALEHNKDLHLAALNVEAVGAQYRIQQSSQLPRVAAEASTTRERAGGSLPEKGAGTASGASTRHAVGLGLSAFEIDLFGRLRAASDAALARYLASEQGRHAAQLALVGAVADAYFAERLALEQSRLAEQTLLDWAQSLQLVRLRAEAGQRGGLDLAQAEGQVAAARADWLARQRAQAQAGHALQLLVGLPSLPADLPEGLPLAAPAVLTQLPGPAFRPAAAAPGHRPGRAAAARRQCRHRRGPCRLLPAAVAHGLAGLRQPVAGRAVRCGLARLALFAADQPAAVPGRAAAGRTAAGRGAQVRGRGGLREGHPDRVPRSLRRIGGQRHLRAADRCADAAAAQRRAAAGAVGTALCRRHGRPAGIAGCATPAPRARQGLLELRRAEIGNAIALYKALGGGLVAQADGPARSRTAGGPRP